MLHYSKKTKPTLLVNAIFILSRLYNQVFLRTSSFKHYFKFTVLLNVLKILGKLLCKE